MATYPLHDKVVLITGASGGIGAACAHALMAEGAKLVLTDVDESAVKEFAGTFPADRVLARRLDVTDVEGTEAVVRDAIETFGRVDVVFANAGIAAKAPSTIRTHDPAEFERIIEVDLLGVWRTVRAALPPVIEAQGQVLLTASLYAFANGAVNAPYAMSKAGVEQFGRALRAELAATGASASVLYPGWIDTPLTEVVYGGDDLATQMKDRVFGGPLGRRVPPSVVADAVVEGLRRRRRRIISPAFWAPVFMMRGLVNAATDAFLDRDRVIQDLISQMERRRER